MNMKEVGCVTCGILIGWVDWEAEPSIFYMPKLYCDNCKTTKEADKI